VGLRKQFKEYLEEAFQKSIIDSLLDTNESSTAADKKTKNKNKKAKQRKKK
jgi:hypothetical protein